MNTKIAPFIPKTQPFFYHKDKHFLSHIEDINHIKNNRKYKVYLPFTRIHAPRPFPLLFTS